MSALFMFALMMLVIEGVIYGALVFAWWLTKMKHRWNMSQRYGREA